MPTLTADEIRAKIANGSIFAISVDTAVFDKYGCNLDYVVLTKLDQFKTGPIRVLLSEIVVKEMTSHIAHDAEDTQVKLKSAIKKQHKRWKRELEIAALPDELALSDDPREAASAQVSGYIDGIQAEIVSVSDEYDVTSELLRRYFAPEPPFEKGDKKKHEFPDGFALLSLEALAGQMQKLVLCVSPDKGWQSFAAESNYLVCVNELNLALSYFNDSGRNTADQTMALWRDGKAPHLEEEVRRAFEYRLDDADFDPEGSTGLQFESEPISATMQWVNHKTASDPVVIATDEETVTFTTDVEALVAFEAIFSFYVKDGIDKDYISLGTEDLNIEERVEFQLTITVQRDLEPEPQVVNVEVTNRYVVVDFGVVEPFGDEDPTHEKY